MDEIESNQCRTLSGKEERQGKEGTQKRKRGSDWNPVKQSNVEITSYGSILRSRTLTDHRLPYLKQV